jgi:hypothetical protein
MAQLGTITVQVTLKNGAAVNALGKACRLVGEIAVDQPWNEGAKEAVKLLRRAAKGLGVQNTGSK